MSHSKFLQVNENPAKVAFDKNYIAAMEQLEKLKLFIEQEYRLSLNGGTNWGDAGSMGKVVMDLKEITDFLGYESKIHAPDCAPSGEPLAGYNSGHATDGHPDDETMPSWMK